MTKKRTQVPKAIEAAVMKEFSHRCAICGGDRPQLHHIDEDPSNHERLNLIPLCPNHHLIDQHDASNVAMTEKLLFFRRHKHRNILKPQFNPVLRRLSFLTSVGASDEVDVLRSRAEELIALVRNLQMGEFYAKSLEALLYPPPRCGVFTIGDPESEARCEALSREHEAHYREQLRRNTPMVEALIVEMLEYQVWP